jgi:hypothetical protein
MTIPVKPTDWQHYINLVQPGALRERRAVSGYARATLLHLRQSLPPQEGPGHSRRVGHGS